MKNYIVSNRISAALSALSVLSVLSVALSAILMASLHSCVTTNEHKANDHWEAYCAHHNVDPQNPSNDDVEYYLDVWCEMDQD